jgi:dihydrofolate reductase
VSPVVVQAFMTLDGVVQAPGGPDEDRDGGFPYGGWQEGYDDPGDEALILDWERRTEALLLGRRTYEIWAGAWGVWSEDAPGLLGELTRRYNRVPKYIASRTLTNPTWRNTTVLGGDIAAEVRALKEGQREGEIRVWGSTRLIRTLAQHDLIDEYRIVLYPLVLGTGKRLFPESFPFTRFDRAASRTLSSGVIVSTYRARPAGVENTP